MGGAGLGKGQVVCGDWGWGAHPRELAEEEPLLEDTYFLKFFLEEEPFQGSLCPVSLPFDMDPGEATLIITKHPQVWVLCSWLQLLKNHELPVAKKQVAILNGKALWH